ncbi:MAG TPA: hypothetical protein VF273_10075 [Pelobium sp.]
MKFIKIFIIAVFVCFGFSGVALAQKNGGKARQIESIKFGYISGKLDLTSEESQNFWPLYKQYQADWNQLIKQKKQSRIDNANNPDKLVDADLEFDENLLALRKKYRSLFGKVLPSEKVKKLYQAERSFREELIKQLKNRPNRD